VNYFSPILGLVTKHDPHTENSGLFFFHYLVLKSMLGMPITQEDINIYISKMAQAQIRDGLYLRSAEHQERTVSHDEITGMIGASAILNTHHGDGIVNYLTRSIGNYPATGKNKYYNPADYFAWYTLTDKWYASFFIPFYGINLLITSNKTKQDTSGKLIYLSELFIMKDKSVVAKMYWKYFTWRMEKMYGKQWIMSLYDIYFSSEDADHPLIELSRGL
jgi:ribosomal protein S24E